MSTAPDRQLVTERADQIKTRKLRWLWPQRIPLGKVTLLVGLPGEGKSLATIDVAARVTTGRNYPDAVNPLSADSEALFICGEDDSEDALVPRLTAAGADLTKVHILKSVRASAGGRTTDRDLRLDLDVAAIRQYLRDHPKTRLIVIDPISNHMGEKSMVDEQEVRELLRPLKEIAQASNASVVCVMHLNKKEGLSAIHRVGGAGAFVGVSRASWLFVRDTREAPLKRYMLPLKNNYAEESISGLGYRIATQLVKIEGDDEAIPHLEWADETDVDADEILFAPRKRASRTDAKAFLKDFLATGPQEASGAYVAAKDKGISERTLDRAKADLGVESRKKGTEGWEWVLPESQSKDAKNACESQGECGTVGTLQSASVRE